MKSCTKHCVTCIACRGNQLYYSFRDEVTGEKQENMNNTVVFFIKFFHTLVFFFMAACLIYILYCGLTATFNCFLVVAISAILTEGIVLICNGWRCPFTMLAQKYGAVKAGVTDLFLPACISKHTFKVSTVLFAGELILLAVRYCLRVWPAG